LCPVVGWFNVTIYGEGIVMIATSVLTVTWGLIRLGGRRVGM
jgi:hypothetical protein